MTKITAWFMSIILAIGGAVMGIVPFGNPMSKFLVTKNAECALIFAENADLLFLSLCVYLRIPPGQVLNVFCFSSE